MNIGGNQTRRLLLIGFGGLIALLGFSSLYTLTILQKIQVRNQKIRSDYVRRDTLLQQLRSEIYLSGTYVRDFLLEPDAARADIHKADFEASRARVQSMASNYGGLLGSGQKTVFDEFSAKLDDYLNSLTPALQWDAAKRRQAGYAFMNDSLLPQRMMMVHLADGMSLSNQKQLESGNEQITNLFRSFRQSLTILLILTLAAGVLLAGGSINRILRLEHLSSTRFNEALAARGALRDLSARLLEVQEDERRAISRELHDEIGQSLSALLFCVGNLSASLSPDCQAEAREQLSEIRKLGERTVAVVRDMSLLLRPSMLDDLGLVPAVQWQAREISRTKNLPVEVNADSISEDLSDEHKTCIYRVVQEALYNVARHARAKHVHISLAEQDGRLLLKIKDDGQGFSPERDRGLGLLGMKERVEHLGGVCRIQSQPGSGTLVDVQLPLVQ
jgi:signal transduction histidine kinase